MNTFTQYKVTWQRAGCSRRAKMYRSREKAERWALILQGRLAEATGLDPDEPVCCSGSYECGCGGRTNRQEWEAHTSRVPPLTLQPYIEQREVEATDWEVAGSV